MVSGPTYLSSIPARPVRPTRNSNIDAPMIAPCICSYRGDRGDGGDRDDIGDGVIGVTGVIGGDRGVGAIYIHMIINII